MHLTSKGSWFRTAPCRATHGTHFRPCSWQCLLSGALFPTLLRFQRKLPWFHRLSGLFSGSDNNGTVAVTSLQKAVMTSLIVIHLFKALMFSHMWLHPIFIITCEVVKAGHIMDYYYTIMCVLSRLNYVRLFATLWNVARQAPLSIWFSRQEYWRRLTCPPLGIFPTKGSNPHLFTWQVCSLPLAPLGKPIMQ